MDPRQNQEDSLLINRTSLERGMFNSSHLKVDKDEELKRTGTFTQTIGPTEIDNPKESDYCHLDKTTGIIPVNTKVSSGEILVSKTQFEHQSTGKPIKKSANLILKSSEDVVIDKVHLTTNDEGGKLVKIRSRQTRVPEIGDKFASLSAQKGTAGQLLNQEDMPFTQEGIFCDVIINPHALPSRMTTSQLIECLFGKKICVTGQSSKPNATAFEDRKIEDIGDILVEYGFNRYGYEKLINGVTGEMMNGLIFIGPTYYQRLKHMVSDKVHCLTLDHEVLTKDGWKKYDELSVNDKVATLQEGKLVYDNPTEIHHYPDYKGQLYHIKNENIDTIITEEHRVCIILNKKYKLVKISELIKYEDESSTFINNEKSFIVNKSDITREYKCVPVFCLSVPGEIFYVRRNGKPVWTGNSRGMGPTQNLNRQPVEGRSRAGGLKVGNMELDTLVAHGVSNIIQERLMNVSDKFKTTACPNCGLINRTKDGPMTCTRCKNIQMVSVILPYSFKLLTQELMAFNVALRLKFKK